MQALRFEKTGSFDELALGTISKPALAPGDALVRVKAAGINGVSHFPFSCFSILPLFQPVGNPSIHSNTANFFPV